MWTKEEAVEFLKGVVLNFTHYNQFVFNFKGEKKGYTIDGRIGGDPDDIRGETIRPEELASRMWETRILDANGVEVYLDIDTYYSSQW